MNRRHRGRMPVAIAIGGEVSSLSRSSGLPIVFGFTPDGRYIMVVYEQIDDVTIYPVTAYDLEE